MRIKTIRNSVAHANLEVSFRDIKKELIELNNDFEFLAINKNIFKSREKS